MTFSVFVIIGLAALVWRVATHRANRVDAILLICMAATVGLVVAQMVVANGSYQSFAARYYRPGMVGLLIWTAWALAVVWDECKSRRIPRVLFLCGLAIFIGVNAFGSLWRAAKLRIVESERSLRAEADRWAAEIILEDWKGPRADDSWTPSLIAVVTPRRPAIAVADDGGHLATLVKGRNAYAEAPDYAFLREGESMPAGFAVIGEKRFGRRGRLYRLCKPIKDSRALSGEFCR